MNADEGPGHGHGESRLRWALPTDSLCHSVIVNRKGRSQIIYSRKKRKEAKRSCSWGTARDSRLKAVLQGISSCPHLQSAIRSPLSRVTFPLRASPASVTIVSRGAPDERVKNDSPGPPWAGAMW